MYFFLLWSLFFCYAQNSSYHSICFHGIRSRFPLNLENLHSYLLYCSPNSTFVRIILLIQKYFNGFFLRKKKVRVNNLLALQKKIDLIVKTFLHDGEESCYRYLTCFLWYLFWKNKIHCSMLCIKINTFLAVWKIVFQMGFYRFFFGIGL